ncbi:hypothetical protein LTR09_012734 [Extremus antarcticus]|uniref:Uncharacterized protein n=1 Tax=Extremus antarcticus TaxID=702011 RepID=A0AAJ0G917_9PEZI|nr:hypothetical protein LTR09_012734 [Extremus antarcticus]
MPFTTPTFDILGVAESSAMSSTTADMTFVVQNSGRTTAAIGQAAEAMGEYPSVNEMYGIGAT